MKRVFLLKLLLMAVLLFGALGASHFLIYKALIVPQLPFIKSVPLLWWMGDAMPVIAVFTLFGWSLKSWRQLIIFSVVAGCVQLLFVCLMAYWNEPGYLKAFESVYSHWTVVLIGWAVSSLVVVSGAAFLFSLGWLLSKAVGRRPALP